MAVGFYPSASPPPPQAHPQVCPRSRLPLRGRRPCIPHQALLPPLHALREVSLPGGKAEEGNKDDADTATREAKEEIGLDPFTHLQPFLSKHLLRVTPVIGILHEKEKFNPVLNEDEVDTIFDCPLEMFLKGKPVVLKYVKFQNVCSLTIFIEDNQSLEDITKIQKIGLIGSTVETTDIKGLKKIDDN